MRPCLRRLPLLALDRVIDVVLSEPCFRGSHDEHGRFAGVERHIPKRVSHLLCGVFPADRRQQRPASRLFSWCARVVLGKVAPHWRRHLSGLVLRRRDNQSRPCPRRRGRRQLRRTRFRDPHTPRLLAKPLTRLPLFVAHRHMAKLGRRVVSCFRVTSLLPMFRGAHDTGGSPVTTIYGPRVTA